MFQARILPPPEVAMILDPAKPPPQPAPLKDTREARIVERVHNKQKRRAASIRPSLKPRPGSLAARNPPTDPQSVDAGVNEYLRLLTENHAGPQKR